MLRHFLSTRCGEIPQEFRFDGVDKILPSFRLDEGYPDIALTYASKYLQNTNCQHTSDRGTSGHRAEGISYDDAGCCCLILTGILLKLPRFENKVGRVPIFCL